MRREVYILSGSARISRDGGAINISANSIQERDSKSHSDPLTLPVRAIKGLVILGGYSISVPALAECVRRRIPLTFLKSNGGYLTQINASPRQELEIAQHHTFRSPNAVRQIAHGFVLAKLQSQRMLMLRWFRGEQIPSAMTAHETLLRKVESRSTQSEISELRGLEGAATKAYFAALSMHLSAGVTPALSMHGRSRRPPRNRFNALLSFGYSMLLADSSASCVAAGLHPALGFLHSETEDNRPALALDVMEEFRAPIVDRLAAALVRRGLVDASLDFEPHGNGWWLSQHGKRKFIEHYRHRMAKTAPQRLRNGLRRVKTTWHGLLRLQADALAETILQGEQPEYRGLPWLN